MSSNKKVSVDGLADAVMESLKEYTDLAADEMKAAVKAGGTLVRKEIQANAPVKSGAYKKSWTVKKVKETSEEISLVVHSKNRYQLAHLLEHGHALRGGGRARAFPHIASAEEKGIKEIETLIERGLK